MNCMSIGEFCSDLNLPFELFPKQKEILETFYGSEARELVAVLGRRSGKDVLMSIMALYEAYRLLETGNPFEYYNIAPGSPIYIAALGCSSDQAKILFTEMKTHMLSSNYFKDKISHAEADKIYFLTLEDKKRQKQLRKDGLKKAAGKVKGSVVIMSGSYNSKSLLGKRYFGLIFNELGCFPYADRVYSALTPGTAEFYHEGQLDSHIITVSSPGEKHDIVYRLVSTPHTNRITFHLATWEVCPCFSRDELKKKNSYLFDEDFNYEFGAVFKSTHNQTVSLRISSNQIETLKKIARKKSYEQDMDIGYVDLIRDSIKIYVQKSIKDV